MRILIVEDSKINRRTIEAKATKWGYEVTCAASGEEAWEIILREDPRLVITDWMLPGMDGPTLCRKIRETGKRNYVYIILITALEDTQSMVAGIDAGADDFVRKPINFDELHARIRAGKRVLNLEQALQVQNWRLTQLSDELQSAQTRLNSDLAMAGKMQRNLLPPRDLIIQGIHFERMYLPSLYVSGDLLNVFRLDEHHVGFYSIDVAGHGVAAAMMSFTLNQLLSPLMKKGCPLKRPLQSTPYYELILPPSRAIQALNEQFQSEADNFLYFTMLYGVIDTRSRALSFCQAGHPNPLYVKLGEQPQFLGQGGFPVGRLPMADYTSITLNCAVGDRLFLYSDGITECSNKAGELFGSERLQTFFAATVDLPIVEILKRLRAHICEWNGSEEFEDDISVLALEI